MSEEVRIFEGAGGRRHPLRFPCSPAPPWNVDGLARGLPLRQEPDDIVANDLATLFLRTLDSKKS